MHLRLGLDAYIQPENTRFGGRSDAFVVDLDECYSLRRLQTAALNSNIAL